VVGDKGGEGEKNNEEEKRKGNLVGGKKGLTFFKSLATMNSRNLGIGRGQANVGSVAREEEGEGLTGEIMEVRSDACIVLRLVNSDSYREEGIKCRHS